MWRSRKRAVLRLVIAGSVAAAINGGTAAARPTTTASMSARTTATAAAAITVGVDWRRVELAPDVSPRRGAVSADRVWVSAVRGNVAAELQGPVLYSSADGEQWDEHDLQALGVPRTTLCGTADLRICYPATVLLLADEASSEIVAIIDSVTAQEPATRDRWLVRGDGTTMTAAPVSIANEEWPAPDDAGNALLGGPPRAGALVDGRALALGTGRRGNSSTLLVHTIEPDGTARVVSDATLPFGVSGKAFSVTALTHSVDGYVAIGHGPGTEGFLLPSSWRSADGVQWEAALLNPADDSIDSRTVSLFGVTAGPAGLVAAGSLRPEGFASPVVEPIFWHSTDGLTWQEVDAAALGQGNVYTITALADRYMAYVGSAESSRLATSADGVEWSVLDDAAPMMEQLLRWGDGLVAIDARHVLISRPGFVAGHDARDPVDRSRAVTTAAVDPAGPGDVGRFWRSVSLPEGLSMYVNSGDIRNGSGNLEVAGERVWMLAERAETVVLLSSVDGATWAEHDLVAAGVPADWLTNHGDTSVGGTTLAVLVPDGDQIVLLLSRYPLDNETIPPQLLLVRSDGTGFDVWLPETFALDTWPGPSGGDDLRFGAPLVGRAHEGRLVLAGAGQWWEPWATGDRSTVVTVIEPDRRVTFVAQNGPPLGGEGWQVPVALHRVGEQFVLVGTGQSPDGGDGTSQLNTWTSADGLEWFGPNLVGAGGDLWDDPAGVIVGPGGLLAYGRTSVIEDTAEVPSPVMWWHSPDGATWTRVTSDAAATGEAITSTWVTDGQYHSIVSGRPFNVLLSSADGITWTRTAVYVPPVRDVRQWGDGVIGWDRTTIYISRPGITAGTLFTG